MLRTLLNPSQPNVYRIQFEENEPEQCEANNPFDALAFYLGNFETMLQDVEVELGGALGGKMTVWLGTQHLSIQDITNEIRNADNYTYPKPVDRDAFKRKRGRPRKAKR